MRRTIAAVFLVVVLASACGTSNGRPSGPELSGYRVVYRVVRAEPDAKNPTTEVVEVRRPYGGRIESRERGKTTTGLVTSREHFWQLGEDGAPSFGVLRPPGGPARSASLHALRDAVRAGRAEAVGSDVVLDRRCSWFAYRDPAPKPLLAPTARSRVESCVDGSGVVLREIWTLDGQPARILEAIELDTDTPSKDRFMEGKDPASTKVTEPKGAEFVETQTIVRDVMSGTVRTPFSFTTPDGWKRDRVALVGMTAGQSSRPTQYLSQTFLRGDELVVLETASGAQFSPPWPTDEGRAFAIGEGEGRMVYGLDRVEVRVLSRIGYARVVAPSEALARTFVERLGA